jgi:hypothetical protein
MISGCKKSDKLIQQTNRKSINKSSQNARITHNTPFAKQEVEKKAIKTPTPKACTVDTLSIFVVSTYIHEWRFARDRNAQNAETRWVQPVRHVDS